MQTELLVDATEVQSSAFERARRLRLKLTSSPPSKAASSFFALSTLS